MIMVARPSTRLGTCELHTLFVENVIARRKELGLTQAAVAERLGVSQSAYANIERGQHVPTLDLLGRVATALDISGSDLLLDVGSPSNQPAD